MKKYTAGRYELKWRGRGLIVLELTQAQARAMFEIARKIPHELESLQLAE